MPTWNPVRGSEEQFRAFAAFAHLQSVNCIDLDAESEIVSEGIS